MHTCILFFVRPSLPSLLSPPSSPNALTDSALTVRSDCYINGLHVPFAGRSFCLYTISASCIEHASRPWKGRPTCSYRSFTNISDTN